MKAFASALEETIKVSAHSISADQAVLLLSVMYKLQARAMLG